MILQIKEKGHLVSSNDCGLPTLGPGGRLPEGRHEGTLKDIRIRFVDDAPHMAHRDRIFQAFEVYARGIWDLLPTAKLWVNGGFVSHKPTKPKDIDVVVLARVSELNAVPWDEILPLVTHAADDGTRVQPMGGLVDGFIAKRGNPEEIRYWDDYWKTVLDLDRNPIPGERKGYVEVKAND